VTKGAFYFHFPSKQAVADALVRLQAQHWNKLQRHWLERGLDPLATAIQLADEAARLIDRDVLIRAGSRIAYQHGLGAVTEHTGPPDWEAVFADLLRRSAERGVLRSGVDPKVAARVLCTALMGAVTVHAVDKPDLPTRVAEVWRMFLGGIASPEWLRGAGANRVAALGKQ
jgi:AcrR family transcriptional regulator